MDCPIPPRRKMLRSQRKAFTCLPHDEFVHETNVVLSITECDGHIWIGTDGYGIFILNPENEEMVSLEHVPGNRNSLPTNSILCLYKDFNNNIWAGSVWGGLINIKETGMTTYSEALPGIEYGLSGQVVLSIYQDEEQKYG